MFEEKAQSERYQVYYDAETISSKDVIKHLLDALGQIKQLDRIECVLTEVS